MNRMKKIMLWAALGTLITGCTPGVTQQAGYWTGKPGSNWHWIPSDTTDRSEFAAMETRPATESPTAGEPETPRSGDTTYDWRRWKNRP